MIAATKSADQSQHSKPTRLINVHTLVLEAINWADPGTSNNGRYAILSHTWGPEEVSLREWQAGTATHKAGYAKIVSACRVAKDEGERYIWVDTCCVDKNNNSELSEAINSMFAWYAGATVCYAVLSDVQGGHAASNSLQQLQESRSGLQEDGLCKNYLRRPQSNSLTAIGAAWVRGAHYSKSSLRLQASIPRSWTTEPRFHDAVLRKESLGLHDVELPSVRTLPTVFSESWMSKCLCCMEKASMLFDAFKRKS